MNQYTSKVHYEEMLPYELRAALARSPIAYLPAGTLEWHGEHLALGNDTLKAEAILERVALRVGGVVIPPTYWGIGGLDLPGTLFFPSELIFSLWLHILQQLECVGFRVIIVLTGHYAQLGTLSRAAAEYRKTGKALVWTLGEYEVVQDDGCVGDHAAKWETSMLWALRPELVDLSRLDSTESPVPTRILLEDGTQNEQSTIEWCGELLEQHYKGVFGADPLKTASRELGEEFVEKIVERVASRAREMLAEVNK